ncbi:hypothetical protein ABH924_003470 [Arthrobacter sp. GAS37]
MSAPGIRADGHVCGILVRLELFLEPRVAGQAGWTAAQETAMGGLAVNVVEC